MEREDVDDAPLAVDRERDLRGVLPPVETAQVSGNGLVESSVVRVEDAIEISAPPPGDQLERGAQGRGDRTEGPEVGAVDMAAFDERHGRRRNAGRSREIRLAPLATKPQRPEDLADPDVIHELMLGRAGSPRLTSELGLGYRVASADVAGRQTPRPRHPPARAAGRR